jgi:hypothetical protein
LKKITRVDGNALDELELQHDICGKPVAFFTSGLPRRKDAKGKVGLKESLSDLPAEVIDDS